MIEIPNISYIISSKNPSVDPSSLDSSCQRPFNKTEGYCFWDNDEGMFLCWDQRQYRRSITYNPSTNTHSDSIQHPEVPTNAALIPPSLTMMLTTNLLRISFSYLLIFSSRRRPVITTSKMRNVLLRIPLKNIMMICLSLQLTPYFKLNIIVSPCHSMQSMTSTIILIVLVIYIQMAATSDPNVRSTRSGILFDMDLSRLT